MSRLDRWRTLILSPYSLTSSPARITSTGGAWNARTVAEYSTFGGVRGTCPRQSRAKPRSRTSRAGACRARSCRFSGQQVDRDAGTVRLLAGTTKNRAGRVFVYRNVTELAKLIEVKWKEHEALARAGTLSPYVFQRYDGSGSRASARRGWLPARPPDAPVMSRTTSGARPCATWCALACLRPSRCR